MNSSTGDFEWKPSFTREEMLQLGKDMGLLDEDGLRFKADISKKEQTQLGAAAKAATPIKGFRADLVIIDEVLEFQKPKPKPPTGAPLRVKPPYVRPEHLTERPFHGHPGLVELRDHLVSENPKPTKKRTNRKNK